MIGGDASPSGEVGAGRHNEKRERKETKYTRSHGGYFCVSHGGGPLRCPGKPNVSRAVLSLLQVALT